MELYAEIQFDAEIERLYREYREAKDKLIDALYAEGQPKATPADKK